MITVQKLFDDLANGELAGMAMGNSVIGSITESHYPKIISAINLGLIDLYKRFPIKEKEIKLHQQTGVTLYYLRSDYVGAPGYFTSDAYIEDDEDDPFEDDLLKVTAAYDEIGTPVPVNNGAFKKTGIFTPSHDIVKMVPADPLKIISLVYRARYPEIVITETFNPTETNLYIPDAIRKALITFVASEVFSSKASRNAEGEPNVAMSFLYKYENMIKQLENDDVFIDVNDTHSHFESKGWC